MYLSMQFPKDLLQNLFVTLIDKRKATVSFLLRSPETLVDLLQQT